MASGRSAPAQPATPAAPDEECQRRLTDSPVAPDTETLWKRFAEQPENAALALLLSAETESDPSERAVRFDCAGRGLAFQKGAFPRLATQSYGPGYHFEYVSERWLLADARRLYDVESRRLVFEVPGGGHDEDETDDDASNATGWEGTEDGPVLTRADGSRMLFRHLSDVNSGGGFTVWAIPSPDGSRVLTAGMGDTSRGEEPLAARLWDVASGRRLWNRKVGPGDDLLFASWSPDGKYVALGTVGMEPAMQPDRGWLNVLDSRTGNLVSRVESEERNRLVPGGSPAPYSDVVWLRDSERLIVSRASSASLIDARTGRERARLKFGFEPDFVTLFLGPDERWVLARGEYRGTGLLRSDGTVSLPLPVYNPKHVFSPDGSSLVVRDADRALLVHLNEKAEVAVLGTPSLLPFDEDVALSSGRFEGAGGTSLSLPFSLPPSKGPAAVQFRFEGRRSHGTEMKLVREGGTDEHRVLLESVGRELEHCLLTEREVSCFETSPTQRFYVSSYDLKTGKRTSQLRFGQNREAHWLASDSLSKLAELTPTASGVRIRFYDRTNETPLRELEVPSFPLPARKTRLDDDLRHLVVVEGDWVHHVDLDDPERSRAYAWTFDSQLLVASLDLARPLIDGDPSPAFLPDCVIGDVRLTSAACVGMWSDGRSPGPD